MIITAVFIATLRFTMAVDPPVATKTSEYVYEGQWHTTNRKLDGTMTCRVTPLGDQKWQGNFYGTWQGIDFDYTESFQGPANSLKGKAIIDGAAYEWKGSVSQHRFKATFAGDRYLGSFDLLRKK